MRTRAFLKRLQAELPHWVSKGWVTRAGERAILEHVGTQAASGERHFSFALGVLGALLLGTGVITFFAANWGLIPKAGKLAILFGSLWATYAVALFAGRRELPGLRQALLLLGVILFGANIHLIAQIYHIDAHYPDGVLMWALGGLLTAWALGSQPAMIAALALATLWSGMETFDFEHEFHWPYLVFFAAALPAIRQQQWRAAFNVAMIGLLLWSLFSFFEGVGHWGGAAPLYLAQIYLLASLALYLLGRVAATYTVSELFAPAVQRYAAIAAVGWFYVLTYPRLHSGGRVFFLFGRVPRREDVPGGWLAVTVAAFVLVALVAWWHRRRYRPAQRPAYLNRGLALLALVLALLFVNLFVPGQLGGFVAVGFNLLFFATMVWLMFAGMHEGQRHLVNLAFAGFALWLMARYFDTFWTLLDRSYFFMLGGLLLIAGGYALERQRRRITARLAGGRP